MWFDNERDNYFIVVLGDDSFSVDTERELSNRMDMSDVGMMDDVKGVYKIVNGKFLAVKSGNSHPINTDEEMPFRYAAVNLYVQSGGRRIDVGTVTLTDH